MNNNNKHVFGLVKIGRLGSYSLLLTMLLSGNVWGGMNCTTSDHMVDFTDSCATALNDECTFAIERRAAGIDVPTQIIEAKNFPGTAAGLNMAWATTDGTCTAALNKCGATGTCLGGVSITNNDNNITFNGRATPTGAVDEVEAGCFKVSATASDTTTCSRDYKLHLTATGGGWGDPHITTVDGIKYDFQSAGEFTALRGKNIEIQTRQTPVSTENPGRENAYTGIASCVSLYTAVATKVGKFKVSIQPNLSGDPDPSGLQLWVDDELRHVGSDGIELSSCNCDSDVDNSTSSGRIVKSADEQGFEIHYADGTKLVITPAWWDRQQKWYLNLNIYDTTASRGIMGLIAKKSWLPALPEGGSVGAKATDKQQRYVQLYETFANSWRVNDKNSLFHYAPNTSTKTFTMSDWPKPTANNSCIIADQILAEKPVTESVARETCSDVEDKSNQENCIFDVMATGHTGFAETYVRTEQVKPGLTKTSLIADQTSSKPGTKVSFTAEIKRKISTIAKVTSGHIQFVVDGNKVGKPIAPDVNGKAVWSTSSLAYGNHVIEARFLPTGFGERFRASNSPKLNHHVSKFGPNIGFSLHVGPTTPTADLSKDYGPGMSIQLDVEYKLASDYSVTGLLGYNQFKGETDGVDDTDWVNLSVNLKYYLKTATRTLWLNTGIGAYMPESGSTRSGVNYGMGYVFYQTAQLRGEIGINQHTIHASGNNIQFFTTQIGAIYNF